MSKGTSKFSVAQTVQIAIHDPMSVSQTNVSQKLRWFLVLSVNAECNAVQNI